MNQKQSESSKIFAGCKKYRFVCQDISWKDIFALNFLRQQLGSQSMVVAFSKNIQRLPKQWLRLGSPKLNDVNRKLKYAGIQNTIDLKITRI